MKKFLTLSLLCIIISLHADGLSDAIRNTDIKAVTTILATNPLTTKNYVKYLDTADEMIRLRRDQVMRQELSGGAFSDIPETQLADQFIIAGLLGFFASPMPISIADSLKYAEKKSFGGKFYSFFESHESPIAWATGVGLTLSCLSLVRGCILVGKARKVTTETIRQRHRDATTIKELLYDHLATLMP